MHNIIIYSDGSCLSNPGPGGWASILTYNNHEKIISGGERYTTNNKMELTAVIEALKALKYKCNVEIVTDSQYVVNAFNKNWIYNWEKNNFKDRTNTDLWKTLLKLVRMHNVKFTWIKGHAGHAYNEQCDKEARRQAYLYSI